MPDIIFLSSAESVALIRDVFVIVFLSLAVIALLLFIFLSLSLYRRLTKVLDAADEAIERLSSVADLLEGFLGAAQNASNIVSISGIVTRLFGRFRRS